MRPLRIYQFAQIVGGKPVGFREDVVISGFATDNRQVGPGDLFLAIKGAKVDGHDFAAKAVESGAIGALVERPVDAPHVLVPNLVQALADLGRSYRLTFNGPVVGITGSAGKTTTKEFIAAALSPLGPILKTEGNRNTEYTAPLVWAELVPDHRAAVIEMAMRGFGQIAHLAQMSKPTIGVVTNIGYSHLEMVGSREGISQAKGELLEALPDNGVAVLWHDDPYRGALMEKVRGKVRTFGFSDEADSGITDYKPIDWTHASVAGSVLGYRWETELPAVGRHIALNASAAMMVAVLAGVEVDAAADAMRTAVLPPMRMEILKLNGANVMLDTYNASPPSMVAAIETLAELRGDGRRLAVIGEMKELGEHLEEAHRMVGQALAEHEVDQVVLLGEGTRYVQDEAVKSGMSPRQIAMASNLDAVREFLATVSEGDSVLIKGSRALELERALPEGVR